jgi:hypothetical protein
MSTLKDRPFPDSGAAGPLVNRLGREASPYLLQHAGNPVAWQPWDEAALARARQEDKPIFLSIGYSTCHWCHVMAHESFEDPRTAAILNAHFIPIKVDREERPDLDRLYMAFVQATTGSGGWPLNVWLTPELHPFYGGTYFPPADRMGQPGFPRVLRELAEAWRQDRAQVAAAAVTIMRRLRRAMEGHVRAGESADAGVPDRGFRDLAASFDSEHGGFGRAPKFPQPSVLHFLWRYAAASDGAAARQALDMAVLTLRHMAQGGIHDHLGGGFHRYAVDAAWQVPHFEKMLYDQAQLACAYLDAAQVHDDPLFPATARGILDYVLRDLTGAEGQFFSAEDADSPLPGNPALHAEGAFYVWEYGDLIQALGEPAARVFAHAYGVEPGGNVLADPHGEFHGRNILARRQGDEETAVILNLSVSEVRACLERARVELFRIRAARPRPSRDDKALTSWNSLMISALARGATVLEEPRYLAAAERAARFLETRLWDKSTGCLWRRYRDGESALAGFAADYACTIQTWLDLYDATFDPAWLDRAATLQARQDDLFWDSSQGGYFDSATGDPSLLFRSREDHDGAEPAPSSLAARNLLRLSRLLDRASFRERLDQTLAAFAGRLDQTPSALPMMLAVMLADRVPPRRILVAGSSESKDTRSLLRAMRSRFFPDVTVMFVDGGGRQEALARLLPYVRDVRPVGGRATAYLCEGQVCREPTHDPQALVERLTRRPGAAG